ncbi:MAG: hypothetical protein ACREQE_08430, partial [Candidatus Binataceae bacterium]
MVDDPSTPGAGLTPRVERFIGIDLGAETIKVVELTRAGVEVRWTRRAIVEHRKEVDARLVEVLADFRWPEIAGAAVTGRLGRNVQLPHVPVKQPQIGGAR